MQRKYIAFLLITPFLIVLDQYTKIWVTDRFALHESLSVIPNYFNLTYIRNTGAAFGMLAQADPSLRVPLFLIVPLIALGIITYVFRKIPGRSLKISCALSLVISGAIGNLIDRFRLGYVVDFLDFHWKYQKHFPAFNVADTVICIGVGILVLDLLFGGDLDESLDEERGAA